jgi:hypothetical protein
VTTQGNTVYLDTLGVFGDCVIALGDVCVVPCGTCGVVLESKSW